VVSDTVEFGGWPRPPRWVWATAGVAAVAVLAGVVIARTGPHGTAASPVNLGLPSVPAQPPVLFGGPVHGVRTDLVIGGDSLWQLETGRPRQVLAGLLANGASPLLAGPGAGVSQIVPAAGGVIAVVGGSSGQPPGAGTRGRVVFIPRQGPARVIARATAVAVAPGGRGVWVQTAVTPAPSGGYPPSGRPRTVWSPTYQVSLAGRRVGAVLRLPLGLVAATSIGLLTSDVETRRLAVWNAVTGRREPLPLPGNALVVAAGQDVVIWQPWQCPARCPLHLTGLQTGAAMTIRVPAGWWQPMQYQEPVAFDRSGTRLALPLERVDPSGNPVAEDLYLIDAATGTARAVPGGPSASDQPLGLGNPGIQLTGAWDQAGRLWVLATSGYGYFQLGYWTGTGPLHVYPPIQGNPAALAAPGTGAVLP
jgi:hypothetical protein